jgi:D-tyrosyl-tRNA(Tyr) deacylase
MIGLLQRVSSASVSVGGREIASIGRGLLVLVAVQKDDGDAQVARLLERLLSYRVFPDADGRMNLSVRDVDGGLLLVPQFTLAADTDPTPRGARARGSRPAQPRPGPGRGWRGWARSPARPGRAPPPARSAPTCRCRWSTTGR